MALDSHPEGRYRSKKAAYPYSRLKWPLLLDGEKGSNRWKRATWDECFGWIEEAFADCWILDAPQMHPDRYLNNDNMPPEALLYVTRDFVWL